jgi:hypothetical protein
MDVEQLHIVLQQSFSADATVRKPAEDTIRNLKNLPGAVQLLLQVAAEKQVRIWSRIVSNRSVESRMLILFLLFRFVLRCDRLHQFS